MRALISGQAGKAAIIRGDMLEIYESEGEGNTYQVPSSAFRYIFSEASDVFEVTVDSEREVQKRLNVSVNQDQALLLTLMLLDPHEDEEIQKEVIDVLADLFGEISVENFVSNRLYSNPLGDLADIAKATKLAHNNVSIINWLNDLEKSQVAILHCRKYWDDLDGKLFESTKDKTLAENILIETGMFKNIVDSIFNKDDTAISNVYFTAFLNQDFKNIRNHRKILTSWLNIIAPTHNDIKIKTVISSQQKLKKEPKRKKYVHKSNSISNQDKFRRVSLQIEEIKKQLRLQNVVPARRYTRDLLKSQLSADDNEFAIKSLCNISSYAHDVFQGSFSLEIIEQAIDLSKEDGWTWGQLADVYISLGQIENAIEALEKAEMWGEGHFASNGYARIFKSQGQLDQAYNSFLDTIKEYSHDESVWTSWSGAADAARELGKFSESEKLYKDAISSYPNEARLRSGYAFLLKEMGRFSEALSVLSDAIKFCEKDISVLVLISQVYREMGKKDEAFKSSKNTFKIFQDESLAYKEHGLNLLALDNPKEALQIFNDMIKFHPYDHYGFKGVAETLHRLGKTELAIETLDDAATKFKNDPYIQSCRANFHKDIGNYTESLKYFGNMCIEFPNNPLAIFGQAHILKIKGEFEKSIDLYRSIDDERSRFNSNVGISSALLMQNKYSEVLDLLPTNTSCVTKSDWIFNHIRGMVMLKSGDTKSAINLFEYGFKNAPFIEQKNYFSSALAIAKLKENNFEEARRYILTDNTSVSNVIDFHIYCAQNNVGKARGVYSNLLHEQDPNVILLREEIGAQFKITKKQPKHDNSWIHERECDLLMMHATEKLAA